MRLIVDSSSTGGPLELVVPSGETVDGLRTRLSRQLNVHKDRIVLLHQNKQLTTGKLLEQGVADVSRLTLQVPVAVEAGLFSSSARVKRMVEVLEKLTECEISDFLSGRSPLAIKLAVGIHTMHVQLQLSAQDVAKLQLDKASGALSSPPPKVNMGRSARSCCSPTDMTTTSAASPPPLAYSAMQSDPRAVSSMDCHRQATSHHSRPHATLLTPSCHATCPLPATTPVCFSDSTAAPRSPLPASTVRESFPSFTPESIKQPGAVIESFVSHSQGVCSGTFSGTLVPCSRSNVSHRHRGIAIILQILDDLLRAASLHQGAPTSICPPLDPPAPEHKCKQRAEEACQVHINSEENQTLHGKLKHLQSLLDQRRHHKQSRRSSQFSQPAHPYRRHHRS
ncbi:midnolin [Syngnathus scovelli]|uniref:midnolin n=1 Tax=Syngnathus scovelli TaxID=161590 RepID=UPI00210FFD81|nr:midnolin [Syngnathus scovelli]